MKKLKKVFITELVGLDKQIEIFNKHVDFPVIYLDNPALNYLTNKLITIIPFEEGLIEDDTSVEFSPEEVLSLMREALLHTDIVLLAFDSVVYVKLREHLNEWNNGHYGWRLFIIEPQPAKMFIPKNIFSFKTPPRYENWRSYQQKVVPITTLIYSEIMQNKNLSNEFFSKNELRDIASGTSAEIPTIACEN